MWTCAGVLALAVCANALTRDQFYPFSPVVDSTLPRGDDVSSPETPLRVPIWFYGEKYETIFVNNYGALSFRANIPKFLNTELPLPYPCISPFYTNIDTTTSGAVYFSETNDPHVITKAEDTIQSNFHEYYDFKPTSVFVTTWSDVSASGDSQNRRNTFQVAIISDGNETFVEMLYPEREIQWLRKDILPNSIPDAIAQVGFNAEDGRLYTLRGSGTHQIRNIVTWSNVHEPGKYVFRVGNIPRDDNIALPDQYNEDDIILQEESNTCAVSGVNVCDLEAKCVDYQAGICCECNEGYYGNGKTCIKNSEPIRVHGRLNGILNEVNLSDVSVQAYIAVADGRAYTALSQNPTYLGNSLQLLQPIGGVLGWLFAKTTNNAKNGYQLTGAIFNYTANIFFPSTGERLVLNQQYYGHDVFDQIGLEIEVNGNIPYMLPDAKLEIADYDEVFNNIELGVIKSESTRKYTNKITGENYEQRLSETITFNTCRFAPLNEEDRVPVVLKATKHYLGYENKDNIVRFGVSNNITPLGKEDPCIEGRRTCDPHSTCVAQGDSFKCICQTGFSNGNDDSSVCIDIDECAIGTHNCDANADCYNHNGGFQCRCRADFEGDGVVCNFISQCRTKVCNYNAHCEENYENGAMCVCNPGFTGDGNSCWQFTTVADFATTEPTITTQETPGYACENCSPYASCVFIEPTGYLCQCKQGYSGDGYDCIEIVQETTTSTPGEADYNNKFVLHSCNSFGCTCPPGYSNYHNDENNLDLCKADQQTDNDSVTCESDVECPANAYCSFSDGQYLGHCVCSEGYEIDLYECVRTDRSCSCGSNAHCIENALSEYICVCDTGYHGDGEVCQLSFSCSNDSDCEFNAECRPDQNSGEYRCQCIDGYIKDQNDACIRDAQLCNGALCVEHASCLYDSTIDVSYCHCNDGFEGDGVTQCATQGSTCDIVDNCHFNAICTPGDNGHQCVCAEGYSGDGYSCTPESNCRTNQYMCDPHASCLKREGSFICECNLGYSGNGSLCELNPRQAGNFLAVSDGEFIHKVSFPNQREYSTPINFPLGLIQMAIGIDVDCLSGKIYWGDVSANTIQRASYDGSGSETFINNGIQSPEGLSVDWSARNIFWTDSKKLTIEVANLDTKVRKVLFAVNDIFNPRGIAVHPQRGKIFWTDWNRSAPKIEWANMDGTQRSIFLDKSQVQLPNALTMDWANDRLCYADAGLHRIACVNIDTRQQEIIASDCNYPFSLASHDDKFYWTDWVKHKIVYIDTRTQTRGQLFIARSPPQLYGLTVAPEQCPGLSSVCQYRNGNCKQNQLCLADGHGSRTCVDGDSVYDNPF